MFFKNLFSFSTQLTQQQSTQKHNSPGGRGNSLFDLCDSTQEPVVSDICTDDTFFFKSQREQQNPSTQRTASRNTQGVQLFVGI